MRVIGYIRVSTDEQAQQGHSLAAQQAKLEAYAQLYELELVEVVVDAGQSAKTLKRPGLQRALSLLKTGQAQGLLVAKLDRLTRSVRDLGALLEDYFDRYNLLSVADQIDTRSAAGRLVLNVLAAVSQWEREAIGERTSAALQHLKSQGVKLGAPAFTERSVIERMRELRAQGLSLPAICQVLTAEGYPTARGGRWLPMTVKRILERAEVTT